MELTRELLGAAHRVRPEREPAAATASASRRLCGLMRASSARTKKSGRFVGLIHDFDFEIHPTLDQHPQDGRPILRERGVPEEVIDAVASSRRPPRCPARILRSRSRLPPLMSLPGSSPRAPSSGRLGLCAMSRRQAVRKKMKDKAFARAVDRQAMLDGAELLGIPFDEHVEFVIAAMAEHADELGLQGVAAE